MLEMLFQTRFFAVSREFSIRPGGTASIVRYGLSLDDAGYLVIESWQTGAGWLQVDRSFSTRSDTVGPF